MEIRYPHIEVQLVGENGNAFMLIGLTNRALKRHHVPQAEITEFTERCFAARSYGDLLNVIQETVVVS